MTKLIKENFTKADRVSHDMAVLKIFEKDFEESFVASPGPGGQNVNKVATCVILKHLETGMQIKCHAYRTQAANRIRARELLVERIRAVKQKKQQETLQLKAQERARKRKRSAGSKEKMLDQKRQQAVKKKSRKRISLNDSICH